MMMITMMMRRLSGVSLRGIPRNKQNAKSNRWPPDRESECASHYDTALCCEWISYSCHSWLIPASTQHDQFSSSTELFTSSVKSCDEDAVCLPSTLEVAVILVQPCEHICWLEESSKWNIPDGQRDTLKKIYERLLVAHAITDGITRSKTLEFEIKWDSMTPDPVLSVVGKGDYNSLIPLTCAIRMKLVLYMIWAIDPLFQQSIYCSSVILSLLPSIFPHKVQTTRRKQWVHPHRLGHRLIMEQWPPQTPRSQKATNENTSSDK